ncbi:hypothetical protein N7447_008362 [Penicillium robsamsonii]|uniref:uncharacterized protein n=1 Tax=Penicillium robsamsonii TaxID=1792511 RepID=UPI002546E36F|nr:uncharacterized protein N7447_008362 [Penicillium robsamsonii]KAJ5816129.1 hypothetical protein N7447_008362 [Penicillium robsamsonii]
MKRLKFASSYILLILMLNGLSGAIRSFDRPIAFRQNDEYSIPVQTCPPKRYSRRT